MLASVRTGDVRIIARCEGIDGRKRQVEGRDEEVINERNDVLDGAERRLDSIGARKCRVHCTRLGQTKETKFGHSMAHGPKREAWEPECDD